MVPSRGIRLPWMLLGLESEQALRLLILLMVPAIRWRSSQPAHAAKSARVAARTKAAFTDHNFAPSSVLISLTNSAALRTARATDLQTFLESSADDSHELKGLEPPARCARDATNVS
jgi:hypothetical protein